jgi:hypothetical protein
MPPFDRHHGYRPYALSASGERFAFVHDRVVFLEEIGTGEVLRKIALPGDNPLRCLALSPNGERLAVAYKDGRVDVWSTP